MTWMQSKIFLAYVTLFLSLIVQSANLLAQSVTSNKGEQPAPSKQEITNDDDSQVEDNESEEELDLEDENYATKDLMIEDDTLSNSPLSIDVKIGRIWVDGEPFNAEFIQFTPAWYVLEDLPLKLGPTIRKEHFIDLETGYTAGGLMEIGLQGNFFWDYGFFTPYLSAEYTFLSRGNLTQNKESGGVEEKGTIKLSSSGYELAIGAQVNLIKDSYLIFETVIIGEKRIKKSGEIVRGVNEVVDASSRSTARSYRGVSIGYLIEL